MRESNSNIRGFVQLLTKPSEYVRVIDMFELGLPELLVIGGAALLLFGPKRLPELAKGLGKGIRDFKKALEEGDEPKETLPPGGTTTVVHQPQQKTPVTADTKPEPSSGESGKS